MDWECQTSVETSHFFIYSLIYDRFSHFFSRSHFRLIRTFLIAQLVKNPPAMQETLVRSLGREDPWRKKGYPLQYSGLENSMDCIVHGVTKSQKWLSDFHLGWSGRCCFHNSVLLLVSLHSKAVLLFRCISAFPPDTRFSEDLCH